MRKQVKKSDIIIIASILAVAGISLLIRFVLREPEKTGLYAEVIYRGTVVETVFLDEDVTFSIDSRPDVVFAVEDNAICFHKSDCPDQLCVQMGRQAMKGSFAACLPNDLMIWVYSTEPDGTDIVAN